MITAFPTAAPRSAVTHDSSWFESMVREYTALAFSVAVRVVRDPAVAEDVVQEAFLSVWRQSATYNQARGSLRSWLLAVVRNRAIDRIRAESSRPTAAASDVDSLISLASETDVWADVSAALDRESLRTALRCLPAEQRQAIEMAYYDGLTHVEISELLAVPLGTVKGRMRLGLEKLRTQLVHTRAA
jgi:RNA polymerase sigma-70 factor (ECF subfamily)